MTLPNFPTGLLVVAAALIDAQGKVLLQQRPAAKHHGGLWEFPGGKVEAGETRQSALVRELEEELGIAVHEADLVAIGSASDPHGALTIELLAARTWIGDPQCLDAQALGWFDPATIAGLPMPPLDIELTERLNASFSRLPSANGLPMSASPTRP